MNRRVVCLLHARALVLRLGYVAATPGHQAIDDATTTTCTHCRSQPATALRESAPVGVAKRPSGRLVIALGSTRSS
jgi:hypothetical protein